MLLRFPVSDIADPDIGVELESKGCHDANRFAMPVPLTHPLIDKVVASMSPLPEIVVVVLVPSDKCSAKDVSDLATKSPRGETYKTSAPVEV